MVQAASSDGGHSAWRGSKDPTEADIAIGALEQRIKPLAEGSCRVGASSTGDFISEDRPAGQPKRPHANWFLHRTYYFHIIDLPHRLPIIAALSQE